MANVVGTSFDQTRVTPVIGQITALTAAHNANRKGAVYYMDTTGKLVLAQANSLANIGAVAGSRGSVLGFVATKPLGTLPEEPATLYRSATVDIGQAAMANLDFGDPVFLSATEAGVIVDTAPSTATQVVVPLGHVIPVVRDGRVDKLILIDTVWLARPDAVAPIAGGG